MAKFKVRRNLLAMRAASMRDTLRVDSDFTAASTVVIGSGGTTIKGILCGSGEMVFGNLAASATSATSLAVTGLTQNHKLFLTASDISGCLTVACVSCSPGGGIMILGVANSASEQYTGATEYFSYLAVLDA